MTEVNTIHFITLKNYMLFFKEVPPPHTAINIRNRFEDELDHHNIVFFSVVTDNAFTMEVHVEEEPEIPEVDLTDEDDLALDN